MTRPVALALLLSLVAACGPGAPAVPAGSRPRPLEPLALFEGRLDPASGEVALRQPGGAWASSLIVPLGEGPAGVSLATSAIVRDGTECGGQSFEATVTATNHTGSPLPAVYAEITSMSLSGREACNGSDSPRPGSPDVLIGDGLFFFGDLAASGGSKAVRWMFANPDSTAYTFTGRLFSAGAVNSTGAGSAWGAAIEEVLLDSDCEALYASVKFTNPPDANNLYLLVDDAASTSTMPLTADPGAWGALSFPSVYAIANSAGVDADYYQAGFFAANGAYTPGWARRITGADTWADAPDALAAEDLASASYHFRIPYASIGAGAPAGHPVRVYALFGLSNQFGLGIHSAAPAPSAPQVALMNAAGGHGLADLDTAAPPYTLRTCDEECFYSDWSEWSVCSLPCEGGVQYRTRTLVPPSSLVCSPAAPEVQACKVGVACDCPSITNPVTCAALISCQWQGNQCVANSGTCGDIPDEPTCTASPLGCVWAGVCIPAP